MEKACNMLEDKKKTEAEKEKDSDHIFGEMIADSLRKIPECEVKEALKIDIQSSILKAKVQLSTF